MYILGISAFYHDSAACLIKNGKIIAAVQEERFTRIKHDQSFPLFSIKYCLKNARINAEDIAYVVFYEKPFLKFERLLETYLAFAPKGFKSFSKAMPAWIKDKLFQKSSLLKQLNQISSSSQINWKQKLLFSEHHLSHAASAFYPSPFRNAAILTLDGVGEWTTSSIALGSGKDIKTIKEIHFPHSIGLLYSAFTYYIGFKVNSGEYKVMGLAPYGKPKYAPLITEKLINVADDGSFQIDMSFFNYATGLTMINKKFESLFGGPRREPETPLSQRDMDLAASIQHVIEIILIKIIRFIAKETKQKNICLAGGVALNCVANSLILKESSFENVWIQPASGDAGGAIGAALASWHIHLLNKRVIDEKKDGMKGCFFGPNFTDVEIESELNECGAKFEKVSRNNLIQQIASEISNNKIIGWMQGKMEFGPRALGNRSILADPRSSKMQRQLNLKIKFRESFRPFAPSILIEDLNDWFEFDAISPYMLFVSDLKQDKRIKNHDDHKKTGLDKLGVVRSQVPAITHVDYSARIQTVDKSINSIFYQLIAEFKKITGCPMLINTSFNVRGEPLVCSPSDAFKCFMGTGIDVLVIENFILYKDKQQKALLNNYSNKFSLD